MCAEVRREMGVGELCSGQRSVLLFAFIIRGERRGREREEKSREIVFLCCTIYHFTVCDFLPSISTMPAALNISPITSSVPASTSCLTFNKNLFSFWGCSLIFSSFCKWMCFADVHRELEGALIANFPGDNSLLIIQHRNIFVPKNENFFLIKSVPELSLFA